MILLAAQGHGPFEPFLAGWIVLLPLIGFLINGVAAVVAGRRAALAATAHASEEEGHADLHGQHPAAVAEHAAESPTPGHDAHAHPADDHAVEGASRPRGWTHLLPSFVAPAAVALAFAIAVVNYFRMLGADMEAPAVVTFWSWMPVGEMQVDAALLLDPLSILMTLVITGVGALIHLFSVGYMKEDPGYPRYMAYLNLFVFFMLVLVLGASFPLMFVGWEGVGLCSYLLIGFWFRERANADAGKKAFIVNRIGDFGFLMAMLLIFANLGSLNFVEVFERAPATFQFGGALVTVVCLFFLLGAAGKSAQIPLYVWLPDAMAGPTPVSALIHAATMVTAGIYLVVRASVLFTMAPVASLAVALVGAATALFAATIGLKQWDVKKVLAYSTVSQLGFMFAAVGMGAYVAGVFHLMTHAFFKALLFLGAGAVIHAMHHALHATHNPADAQDMRNMGGLRRFMPVTFATMAIATLAIAGIPPFAGFFSKDEIIGAAWIASAGELPLAMGLQAVGVDGRLWFLLIGAVLSLAALLTAFYMGRLMLYTFFGPNRTGDTERGHLHEVGWTMSVPLIVLAVFSTIGGLFNVDGHIPVVKWFEPLAIGGELALHHWLEPVIHPAEEVARAQLGQLVEPHHALWPILLALLIGAGGLALAWYLLKPRRLDTAERHPAYARPAERVLYHKYYVDELYDRTIVRPVGRLSGFFSRVVDHGLIDGIIDGSARLVQGVGILFGRLQTGHLNTYAFILLLGALAVIARFAL